MVNIKKPTRLQKKRTYTKKKPTRLQKKQIYTKIVKSAELGIPPGLMSDIIDIIVQKRIDEKLMTNPPINAQQIYAKNILQTLEDKKPWDKKLRSFINRVYKLIFSLLGLIMLWFTLSKEIDKYKSRKEKIKIDNTGTSPRGNSPRVTREELFVRTVSGRILKIYANASVISDTVNDTSIVTGTVGNTSPPRSFYGGSNKSIIESPKRKHPTRDIKLLFNLSKQRLFGNTSKYMPSYTTSFIPKTNTSFVLKPLVPKSGISTPFSQIPHISFKENLNNKNVVDEYKQYFGITKALRESGVDYQEASKVALGKIGSTPKKRSLIEDIDD